MKYASEAESRHFFDFVFYETDKKNMYIYCPNCRREYETEISRQNPVSRIKEQHKPCECFSYRGVQPKYNQSRYEYRNLNRVISVGEFENRGNGDAALCVYWYKADFSASNYDAFGYVFKRHPVFSEEKVIEILYKRDGTVSMKTSLYIPMSAHSVSSGRWRDVKRWRYSCFSFDIIEESFSELKGTCLERFLSDIPRFLEKESDIFNIERAASETVAAFLIQMHTAFAVRKLWKAGYERLVTNKTFESMSPKNYPLRYIWGENIVKSGVTVNYRGKNIENILKVEPSKIDSVFKRKDLSVSELKAARKILKIGVELNAQNVKIAMSGAFGFLIELFQTTNQSMRKMFKYLRYEANKNGGNYGSAVSDYYDYIDMLRKLGAEYTPDVVFPSHFKEAHDRTAETLRAVTDEKKNKAFESAVRDYYNASFDNGQYSIKVIKSIKQLKSEAAKMHNCSAGYVDRIIGGDSVIFVIRQSAHPRTAFCMLEYSPKSKNIVQNRGIRNTAAPSDVQKFAETWLKNTIASLRKRVCEVR